MSATFTLDTPTVDVVKCRRSGCSELDVREKSNKSSFRFRSKKDIGNGVSPRTWSSLPTGIVTTPGAILSVVILPLEPLMYGFVSGTKLTSGTGSLKSRESLAGLKQRVVGLKKDTTAWGYSVATCFRHCPTKLCFWRNRGRFCRILYTFSQGLGHA